MNIGAPGERPDSRIAPLAYFAGFDGPGGGLGSAFGGGVYRVLRWWVFGVKCFWGFMGC